MKNNGDSGETTFLFSRTFWILEFIPSPTLKERVVNKSLNCIISLSKPAKILYASASRGILVGFIGWPLVPKSWSKSLFLFNLDFVSKSFTVKTSFTIKFVLLSFGKNQDIKFEILLLFSSSISILSKFSSVL